MSFKVGGFVFSRLMLALSVFLTPLYFMVLFAFSPVKLRPYPLPFDIEVFSYPLLHTMLQCVEHMYPLNMAINYIFAPLFFSLPWLLFAVISHERIIKTLQLLDTTTTIIPLRYRIFYGFNTLLLVALFVLPVLFPVLSVVSSVILAGRVLNASEWFWEQKRLVKLAVSLITFAAICGGPIYLVSIYYLEKLHVFIINWFWDLWVNNIVVTYTITMCIVDALAVGSVVWLFYAGSAEFEARTFGVALTKPPYKAIAVLETVFFLLFAYIGLPYLYIPGVIPRYIVWGSNPSLLYERINYVCLGIISLVTIIGSVRGLKARKFNFSIFGLIVAGSFLCLDMAAGGYLKTLAVFPKILAPFVLQFALQHSWWVLMVNFNYFLNLYIPHYELPKILTQMYLYGGAKEELAMALFTSLLIDAPVSYATGAIAVTAVMWFTTVAYCFARAGRVNV
ncbi:MAG: hypothetical protein QXK94_07050 [Candidatus Jordarchaeales archaeon]